MEFIQNTLFGKTSAEPSLQTKERTSEQYSKASAKLQTKPYLYLNLTNGHPLGASWEMVTPSRGESWMHNIGESPSVAEESFLWQVLENHRQPISCLEKYYLSPKACEGVLGRAERRGKQLPKILKTALEQQIIRLESDAENQGGGKSGANVSENKSPTLTTTHQGEPAVCYGINGEKAGTLDASYYKGCGERQGIERDVVCYELDQVKDAVCIGNGQMCNITMKPIANSLDCMHDQQAVAYSIENHPNDSRVKIDETGKVQALTSRMGTGGGNVPMVMEQKIINLNKGDVQSKTVLDPSGTTPSLYAGECRGGGGECYVLDTLTSGDHHAVCYWNGGQTAGTLTANNAGGAQRMPDKENFNCVIQEKAETQYIVRRLTPIECARLQGFPDWWCSGLESDPTEQDIDWWYEVFETHRKAMGKSTKPKSRKRIEKWLRDPYSDTAAYKMWGNGVALPCVYYVLKGIVCQDR